MTSPWVLVSSPQRINILQQLLREEVEGLTGDKCAPLNGGSSLDMAELQPLLAEISGTPSAPEQNSGALHLPRLSQCSELPEPCLPAEGGEAQPCPPAEPGPPESSPRREPGIPEPCAQEQPEVSEPCPPVEPGCLKADSHRQAGLLEPSRRIEPGASEAGSLEPKSVESSPQPCRSPWAPATTTLIFSSQRPLCANPPIHSLQSQRPPTGQAGKEWVRRDCEQRRSSSPTGSGTPTLPQVVPGFLLPTYPAPAWRSFGKKGGLAPQAPRSYLAGPLVGEWERAVDGGSIGLRSLP